MLLFALAIILALMCENVNAAPQEMAKGPHGLADGSIPSPAVAAPFTLAHPLCQTGFMLRQRIDERDRFGIIIKSKWKMTDCVRAPRILYGRKV